MERLDAFKPLCELHCHTLCPACATAAACSLVEGVGSTVHGRWVVDFGPAEHRVGRLWTQITSAASASCVRSHEGTTVNLKSQHNILVSTSVASHMKK